MSMTVDNNNDHTATSQQLNPDAAKLLEAIAFDPAPETRGRAFDEFIKPSTTLHVPEVQ